MGVGGHPLGCGVGQVSGRVTLVAGGSKGIGLACARRFQRAGEKVVVTYRSDPPPLSGDPGCNDLIAKRCDVTVAADVEQLFSEIEAELGAVEVLVYSAGITDDSLLMRMSDERWASVIETNLTACFRVTKRAIPQMLRARSGRIVLISSVVALTGNPGQSNYAASKAGLIGFARSLAREVASRSVTVNVIAPGLVETDMLTALKPDQLEKMVASVPLGRSARPEEIASVVEFIASEEASYVTGAVVPADGGLGMGH
jgi:3-oxoacyl-[acyl-carrier protein] reductase